MEIPEVVFALSIRQVTQKPIKFVGIGEKMSDLEVFYPDRMASRILGMGDVLSLIEKVQADIDEKAAKELSDRMMSQEFNFDDFLEGMSQMKKLGPISKILEMMPGVNSKELQGVDFDKGEKELVKVEAMIRSMTKKERMQPSLIKNSTSRKKRIANGSGTTLQDVNKLLKMFDNMKKMTKQMKGLQKYEKRYIWKVPFYEINIVTI